MERSQFCWVVERIEWDQDLDGLQIYWENRTICGAFFFVDDARSYVEKHANRSRIPYLLSWRGTGKTVYSGHAKDDKMEEGVRYELHYTALN